MKLAPVIWLLSLSAFAKKNYTFMEQIAPPKDISVEGFGSKIDALFMYISLMDTFYFILVCIGLFGFSYLYSAKRHPKPYYTYGNKKKHLTTTLVIGLAVFFSIDSYIATTSNNDLINTFWNWPDPAKEEVLRVQVQGQQWVWNFRYPGEDGEFNTLDDIVTTNDLRIPAGKKVLFQITSKDVIHSLYFPNFRIKVDAMPGRISRLWIQTKDNEVGEFDIACAEMCGTYHYRMQAKLTVYNDEDYKNWNAEARQIAKAANDPDNMDNLWGWSWDVTPKAVASTAGTQE